MIYRCLAVALTMGTLSTGAHAALAVVTGGQTFTQNFDGLAYTGSNTTNVTWTNDSTLTGWSLFTRLSGSQKNGGVADAYTTANYRVDNGTSNTGWFYSYGATTATDRALGSIASSSSTGYWNSAGSGTVAGWMAVALTNSSGSTLNGFSLGYTGEQWRDAGNTSPNNVAQSLTLQYGFGSSFAAVSSWQTPGSLFDFVSPKYTTTAAALDGNAAANRVTGLGGTRTDAWAAGDTLWIRWADTNDANSDAGLAIDNFTFTAGTVMVPTTVPLPAALPLLVAGLGAFGAMGRRSRRHNA